MVLLRFLQQPGPELWVGDRNDVHCPFSQVLSVKIGDPIFGHQVMNVASGKGNTGPFMEERHNPGNLFVIRSGLQGQDGFPSWREHGAPHEIRLAPDSTAKTSASRDSAVDWPVKSTDRALLMAVILLIARGMISGLLV